MVVEQLVLVQKIHKRYSQMEWFPGIPVVSRLDLIENVREVNSKIILLKGR